MDHQMFDDLARRIGRNHGRRAVLRAVAAGVISTLAPSFTASARQLECPDGCGEYEECWEGRCVWTCDTDRDCRSSLDDPCISNTCVEHRCYTAIVDCQPGYECCAGKCCAKPCVEDAECAVFDPCRVGACREGYCEFTELDPCSTCTSDLDCAGAGQSTVCCSGACWRPCPAGTVMGKGCECKADNSGVENGLVVRDDASGSDGKP